MEDQINPYASPAEVEDSQPLAAEPGARPVIPYATARTRARWVVGFLAVILLGNLVSVGSSWLQIDLLERMKVGNFTADETHWNDLREGIIGVVLLGVSIGAMIFFLMWFHRAHRNLRSLGVTDLRFSSGWAIGWWFIPIFSLFRPYQVMKEIWQGSNPATMPGETENPWPRPSLALIGWWWALFLIMGFAGQISFRLAANAKSIEELVAASWVDIGDCLITVLAALLAILVVRRVTANQDERHWRLTQGSSEQAA